MLKNRLKSMEIQLNTIGEIKQTLNETTKK